MKKPQITKAHIINVIGLLTGLATILFAGATSQDLTTWEGVFNYFLSILTNPLMLATITITCVGYFTNFKSGD
jgi:hypothetical protein